MRSILKNLDVSSWWSSTSFHPAFFHADCSWRLNSGASDVGLKCLSPTNGKLEPTRATNGKQEPTRVQLREVRRAILDRSRRE
jgi:hypothetical protein